MFTVVIDTVNGLETGALCIQYIICLTSPKSIYMRCLTSPNQSKANTFFQERGIPKTVDPRDCVEGEQLIQRGKISIIAVGRELEPIHTSVGTVFINTKYLKPFSDEADGYELYERKDADGKTYIVAKSGMLIIGIILPFNVDGPAFLKELELITEGVRLSLKSEKAKTEQISMTD